MVAEAGGAPLEGVRVVDLTSIVMGPLATQIFGDLGADVITVEDPRGTLSRVMTAGPHPQLSGVALNLLRNKRNIVLDLKTESGHRAFLDLVATADVLVTNLRPGTLERLRLSYDEVAAVRPDLVFCQAQGYPSDSPAADAPAYDDVIQAATGLPDAFRRFGGEPQFAPTLMADKVSGLTIAYAVLAALLHRERTGQGQRVEVPMVDVMTAFVLVEHAGAATARPAQGAPGYQRILNPERRPQRTRDGWISVLPYTRQNFADLFRAGGRPDLAEDERIRTTRDRLDHADALYREVATIIAGRTTDRMARLLRRPRRPRLGGPHPRRAGRRPPRRRPPGRRPLQGPPPAGALLVDDRPDGTAGRRPSAASTPTRCWPRSPPAGRDDAP